MALFFRKRIKILPGVTLNLSKSGVSATVGRKGASVSVGKRGTYLNLWTTHSCQARCQVFFAAGGARARMRSRSGRGPY